MADSGSFSTAAERLGRALVARRRGAEPLAGAAHLLELLQRQLWAPAAVPA